MSMKIREILKEDSASPFITRAAQQTRHMVQLCHGKRVGSRGYFGQQPKPIHLSLIAIDACAITKQTKNKPSIFWFLTNSSLLPRKPMVLNKCKKVCELFLAEGLCLLWKEALCSHKEIVQAVCM